MRKLATFSLHNKLFSKDMSEMLCATILQSIVIYVEERQVSKQIYIRVLVGQRSRAMNGFVQMCGGEGGGQIQLL